MLSLPSSVSWDPSFGLRKTCLEVKRHAIVDKVKFRIERSFQIDFVFPLWWSVANKSWSNGCTCTSLGYKRLIDFYGIWRQKGPLDHIASLTVCVCQVITFHQIALIFDLITSVKQKHVFQKESQTWLQDIWTCWMYVNNGYQQLIHRGRCDFFFLMGGEIILIKIYCSV